MNIVAVDFQSHKNLPIRDHHSIYFKSGDKESFIESILNAESLPSPEKAQVENFSYENRVKKLVRFARLEGLEPPTL